jgi:hypothetical protein
MRNFVIKFFLLIISCVIGSIIIVNWLKPFTDQWIVNIVCSLWGGVVVLFIDDMALRIEFDNFRKKNKKSDD